MARPRMSPDVKARLVASMTSAPPAPARGEARSFVIGMVQGWIFDGLLRDGDVISQEDLADVLGLSRMPVRDGLLALRGTGWVRFEPDIGARAIALDADAVRDNFDLISSIWSLLIRRAVARGSDPAPLLRGSDLVRAADTPAEMMAAAEAFRGALCALASAPRLEIALYGVSRIVVGDFYTLLPDAMDVQKAYAPTITKRLAKGDGEAAAAAAVALHRTHAENLIRLLDERGALATTTDLQKDPPARRADPPGRSLHPRSN